MFFSRDYGRGIPTATAQDGKSSDARRRSRTLRKVVVHCPAAVRDDIFKAALLYIVLRDNIVAHVAAALPLPGRNPIQSISQFSTPWSPWFFIWSHTPNAILIARRAAPPYHGCCPVAAKLNPPVVCNRVVRAVFEHSVGRVFGRPRGDKLFGLSVSRIYETDSSFPSSFVGRVGWNPLAEVTLCLTSEHKLRPCERGKNRVA